MLDSNPVASIVAIVGLIIFVGMVVTFAHIVMSDDIGKLKKFLWIVLILIAPLVGIILYYLVDG